MHPQGKHFFYTLFVAIAVLCAFIFRPFFVVVVIGASLAVVFHPLYVWMRTHVARNISWLAALLTTFLFIVIIGVPLFFIGSQVLSEGQSFYKSISEDGGAGRYLDSVTSSLSYIVPEIGNFDLKSTIGGVVESFTGSIAGIFTATLHTIFSFLLIILSLFYFLKDGEKWKRYIVKVSPLADTHDNRILQMLEHAVSGIMKGYLLVALIQGTMLGIGLWIFGVPNPVLWGVLAGIASVIPSIGTAIVAIPAILFLLATSGTGAAIGLTVWSLVLVGTIDNLLNPIVLGKRVSLPPLVILFSVLGGITLFGPAGIIIGPLSISLLYTLLVIYRENFKPAS